jgi:hypothetical protein
MQTLLFLLMFTERLANPLGKLTLVLAPVTESHNLLENYLTRNSLMSLNESNHNMLCVF